MMYEAVIPIHVALGGPGGGLGAAIDDVTDQLALIDERTPELLDYAVSSYATDNAVVFELTVEASDDMEALAAALSWVRTAIRATGGNTPGWTIEGSVSVATLAGSGAPAPH
jgi:hypothetical protein